jgi:hypothetical protein
MIEQVVRAPLDWLSAAAGLPPTVIALLTGTLFSWLVTQWVKFFIPFAWSAEARHVTTQVASFVIGFGITYILWPVTFAWVAGLLVGMWSPALWTIASFFIGLRWPALRDRLSQDVRKGEDRRHP